MLEAISIGVVSNTIFDGLKYSSSEVWDLLTREEYEQEADVITVAITTALKESVVPALVSDTGMTEAQLGEEWDWTAIAAELDALEVWSQDRQIAIAHLTDAIEAGLGLEVEVDSTRRTTLEAAVAAGYKHAVRQFIEEIAGTPLANKLELLTDRELLTIADTIEKRLAALEQELRGTRADLRDAGFVRLDPLYLERHKPIAPEIAWRTGFDFAEIAAAYPLLRERPATTTDDRQVIATEVYERLSNGENLVVKGEGGTGKSTVCKRVAYRWYEAADRGTVFYRESARTTPFETPGTLGEAIRAAEDDVLVVVEDAPSGGANTIFEVLADFEGSSDVRFLFDARTGAWEVSTEVGGHASLDRQRQQLGIVEMPALDERECERALAHYDALTDEDSGRTSEQLYEEVRSAEVGGPLVLAYQLTGPATGTDHPVSALHADVHRAYAAVEQWADDAEFSQRVTTMVNVLNAAELPVTAAFVHAVADDSSEHPQVERTLDFLEGTMLEQSDDGLRLPHQLWSALYLQHMLDVAGERLARDRFERCVEALCRLFDAEEARATITRWVRPLPDSFTAITESPEKTAGRFVRHLADIGTIQPSLGPLYGTPETWPVELPAPCSITARFQWFITRGTCHTDRGAFDAAQAEFEHAEQLIETTADECAEPIRQRAMVHNCLGVVAENRGELSAAEAYHEEALALFRKVGDRHREAASLTNLGLVAQTRGELEAAESYHTDSLALSREVGDRRGEAVSRNNLGLAAETRGELEAAESYYTDSLALFRKVGARHGEAKILTNLGNVAETRGELEAAESYHTDSLALDREIGARHGEANSLGNLGNIAYEHGELEAAESYYTDSLALFRKVGDRHREAASLTNLGLIAHKRGELEAAESHYTDSLALFRKVGDRHGEALVLSSLGRLALARDDRVLAEEHFEASIDLLLEHDMLDDALNVFAALIDVCEERGAIATAIEWCEQAIDCAEQIERDEEREQFRDRRSELRDGEE